MNELVSAKKYNAIIKVTFQNTKCYTKQEGIFEILLH